MPSVQIMYSYKNSKHEISVAGNTSDNIMLNQKCEACSENIGVAKQLLISSTLMCYSSSLIEAMNARKVQYSEILATATAELGKSQMGASRIVQISLDVKVRLENDEQLAVFERCKKIMKHGCLITGSLHDGIHMEYSLDKI